ncbi:MAG TPA: archease [Alphaproteobacteria bacterium]|nr:archease [Alphaproteobacteria bacterium]
MNLNHDNDKYKFFDKTADAKFQAYGSTLDESFKNAQEAVMSVMYDVDQLSSYEPDETREIIVQGENLEMLLYYFLEETVFLLSAEFFAGLVDKIQIIHKEEEGLYKLKAILRGTLALNLEGHGEVKAITYNEMYVKFDPDKDKYVSQVVVDI